MSRLKLSLIIVFLSAIASISAKSLQNFEEKNLRNNVLIEESWKQALKELNVDDYEPRATENIDQTVKFILYTKHSPIEPTIVSPTKDSVRDSKFDRSKETKFITHGWMSNGNSDTLQSIKDAYLKNQDVNVFLVDWQQVAASTFYLQSAFGTKDVGMYVARFLDLLYEMDTDPGRVHLIGHSLGAHVSGFAGEFSSRKIKRISGLDPAGPLFDGINFPGGRLSRGQADFVDVIHTSAGTYGFLEPIGDADFYPNWGELPQPGCDDILKRGCSHGRSWIYFAESINPENKFMASKCESFEDVHYRRCSMSKDNSETALMGEYADAAQKGVFLLVTNDKPRYSRGAR